METITIWKNQSAYINSISPACKQCAQGSKMVLLVTGLCSSSCFYCPISQQKQGKDVIYADEWKLDSEENVDVIITEAKTINASGAGITGGDPLHVWQRVCRYIRLLKNEFGDSFHIHLYTSGLHNADHLSEIISAGVDEIRFHPLPQTWESIENSPLAAVIDSVTREPVDVAIEIPSIPSMENQLLHLISWADSQKVNWINLNELEFSETNMDALLGKGYHVKGPLSDAVQGSQETAFQVLQACANHDLSLGVHYCSVSFKDGIQLRNRLQRRANIIKQPYDVITDDGTLVRGIIIHPTIPLPQIIQQIQEKHHVPSKYMSIDNKNHRVLIAPWIIEKISKNLTEQGYQCFIVEEYPTADHLEVERIPLPLAED